MKRELLEEFDPEEVIALKQKVEELTNVLTSLTKAPEIQKLLEQQARQMAVEYNKEQALEQLGNTQKQQPIKLKMPEEKGM